MATEIGSLYYDLTIDDKNLKSQLNSTDNAINKFGDHVKSNGEQVRQTMIKVGIAVAAVGAGITLFAKNATDYTVELVKDTKKLSRETGLATDQASRLLYVTSRLGIDAAQASASFGIFSKQIKEASLSVDPVASSIGKLGVNVRNTDNTMRGFSDILLDVSDKFKLLPDGPQKTAIALELFGRSGKDMIKVLNLGSEGIKDLEKRADELGLTLTAKTIGAVSRYVNSQKDLKDSTNALKLAIGELTIPVLTRFNQNLNGVLTTLIRSAGPFRQVIAYVGAFGGPILSATGGLIALGANMVQITGSVAKLGMAFRAAGAFLVGPWGLAIAAAIALIGGLTYLFTRHKQATEEVTSETEDMKTAEEDLTDTLDAQTRSLSRTTQLTNALKDAQFDAEGTALDVERAQRSYNDAVKEYGPKSLEAREAHHQLESANMRLKEAQDKVKASQDLVNLSEGVFAGQTPVVQNAIQLRIDKFAGVAGTIKGAIDQLIQLDTMTTQKVSVMQNTFGDLQTTASGLQRTVDKLNTTSQSVGINLGRQNVGAGGQIQGMRAEGGPVSPFLPYLVGEQGPEIIIPKQAGTVISNDKLGSNLQVNIGQINNKQDEDWVLRRLNRNQQLASMGAAPVGRV